MGNYMRTYYWMTEYYIKHGYPPSHREIRTGAKVGSPVTVCKQLDRMERDGLIVRGKGSRAIRFTKYSVGHR